MRHMGAGAAQSEGRFSRPAHRSIWNGLARERTAENGRVRIQLQVAALDDDTSPEKQVQTFVHEQVLRLSGTLSILENLHNDV